MEFLFDSGPLASADVDEFGLPLLKFKASTLDLLELNAPARRLFSHVVAQKLSTTKAEDLFAFNGVGDASLWQQLAARASSIADGDGSQDTDWDEGIVVECLRPAKVSASKKKWRALIRAHSPNATTPNGEHLPELSDVVATYSILLLAPVPRSRLPSHPPTPVSPIFPPSTLSAHLVSVPAVVLPDPVPPQSTSTLPLTPPPVPQRRLSSVGRGPADSRLVEDGKEKKKAQSELGQYLSEAGRHNYVSAHIAQRALDGMPGISFVADPTGHVGYFSPYWYEYTGLPLTSSMEPEVFHPDDHALMVEHWTDCITTGKTFLIHYRVKSKDGEWRWMYAQSHPIRDDAGKIEFWVGSITDVNELIQVRSDTLKLKAHINVVMTSASLVLLSIDSDCTINFWEGSLGDAAAVSARPLGKKLREVWPDQKLQDCVEDTLRRGPDHGSVDIDSTVNGKRTYLRYRLVPLRDGPDESVSGAIIVASNMTDLIVAEEALQQSMVERAHLLGSETAAKEASRQKTEFITGVSHELRTPLSGMMGICELLLEDKSLSPTNQQLIQEAVKAGENLLELIGNVLDLRKVETGKLAIEEAPLDLSDVLDDAMVFTTSAAKLKIKFEQDIGPHYTGLVIGDRLRTRQILFNGLSNALKFTRAGGLVVLRMRQEAETADKIDVVFEIQDNGIGIGAEQLKTLFRPFQQADSSTARQFGGSGLGLVITRSLAELLGGSAELTSVKGQGSTLIVHIPFRKAPMPTLEPRGRSGSLDATILEEYRSERRAEARILLAEDNDLLRDIMLRLLHKMQFVCDAVGDGAAVVEAVKKTKYDIILMDCQMPGVDGMEATRRIRQLDCENAQNVRIIALTANAVKGHRETCLEIGMNGYLTKPARKNELEAAIWEQLDVDDVA
ncbi:histidine kinase [Pseudohyphozyma bogoriensis]|nr:histidine kinase [Pseudohyphozyma bogoriensis]